MVVRSDEALDLIGPAFQRHEAVTDIECLVMPATSCLRIGTREAHVSDNMVKCLGNMCFPRPLQALGHVTLELNQVRIMDAPRLRCV